MFEFLKVGDPVTRILARSIEMKLTVTHVTETTVQCGDWIFDRATGAELDEDLHWTSTSSGAYLIRESIDEIPRRNR